MSPRFAVLSEFSSRTLSVTMPTKKGAEQSQIGMLAVCSFATFRVWPQYLLPAVSPQFPPEPKRSMIACEVLNTSQGKEFLGF